MKIEDLVDELYDKEELTPDEKEFLKNYKMFSQYFPYFDKLLKPLGLALEVSSA